MYVCMYVCMYVRVRVERERDTGVCMYVCMYSSIYVCTVQYSIPELRFGDSGNARGTVSKGAKGMRGRLWGCCG